MIENAAYLVPAVLAGLAVYFTLAWIVDRAMDFRTRHQARPDNRIPARDRELLGEDAFGKARRYFSPPYEGQQRTRMAIYKVTGGDCKAGEHESR